MRFGKWKVRRLCRSGSLTTVVRKLARYKLYLLDTEEVRWDYRGTVRAVFIFYYKKLIVNGIF
jgi:hypothetical protein